ncbi:hypothetical protein BDA96_09G177900 [Sorghum bicolor]|uniref:Uncharacterized protein n=1 Tax=Sorghum bicolor TaxID=4558 RepID=A0A921QAE7_SORBI|nr:hypothetical protein BDA96_09G177900 [Sorghum bicolor]
MLSHQLEVCFSVALPDVFRRYMALLVICCFTFMMIAKATKEVQLVDWMHNLITRYHLYESTPADGLPVPQIHLFRSRKQASDGLPEPGVLYCGTRMKFISTCWLHYSAMLHDGGRVSQHFSSGPPVSVPVYLVALRDLLLHSLM